MSPTRYLRPRTTAPLDDATLAAAVAVIIGPPGLVRYPPRSPALFPPPRPVGRTVRRTAPVVGAGLALAGLLVAVWPGGSPSAVGMGTLPPATVSAPATARPSATSSATATLVAPTATVRVPRATAASLILPVETVLPTVPVPSATQRPVPPPAIPPRLPPPATATTHPVVQLPAPMPTAAPVIVPPVTPGSGPAGGDWSGSLYTRSATIHADPTP